MPRQATMGPIAFPRPRGAILAFLVVILGVWVLFGILINWAHTGEDLFQLLVIDRDAVFRGEIWRLLTAPFIHHVEGRAGVSHVLNNLLMLYFFGTSLQERWGSKRLTWFLLVAAIAGEVLQLLLDVALPGTIGRGVHQRFLFGAEAMSVAATIAWGFSNRGQSVLLMFVLPVEALTLAWLIVGFYVLALIAIGAPQEGIFAPFGGMAVGYLLGAGSPSPLRKLFLRRKLRQLEKKPKHPRPVGGPDLRVIRGSRDEEGPKDKRWLN